MFKVKFIYLKGELYISGKYIEVKYLPHFLKQGSANFFFRGPGSICVLCDLY